MDWKHLLGLVIVLAIVCAIGYVIGAIDRIAIAIAKLERRGQVAPEKTSPEKIPPAPRLELPSVVLGAAPMPFGNAHARASLATLLAGIEYVRARLDAVPYHLDSTDCRSLAWLLGALGPLPKAITGHPQSNSAAIERSLDELDRAVGPGSWWRVSQKLDRQAAQPPLEVPEFAKVYDSIYTAELIARPQSKRFSRKVSAEAKHTSLSVTEAQARMAQSDCEAPEKQMAETRAGSLKTRTVGHRSMRSRSSDESTNGVPSF